MPPSNSRLSYVEAYEAFDRAAAAPKGIRVHFPDRAAAAAFQFKLMKARQLDREDNLETYPPGHALYGQSQYDRLQVRLRANGEGWVLLIEPLDTTMSIEEIE